ncbi:MAG: hypothetical protein JWL82_455 [Parcubacteria group bacterium]|nr:hypothetical protein [Parcubacteria group bacterium]
MERVAFDLLRNMEHSWWYSARAVALKRAMLRAPRIPERILDYGAGWGAMHDLLQGMGKEVYAYEPDTEARAVCMKRGYREVFATEAEALALTYDCISLLDVLEHIEDDAGFLARAKNSLAPGGLLLISVPAFQFLWSVHDVEHQHFRRYTTRLLKERFRANGYTTRFASHWNMILFFPAALMRLMGKTGESALGLPKLLDSLFFFATWVESLLMYIVPLPFGTGIVALAQKSEV